MDGVTSPDIDLSAVDDYKLVLGDILFARTGASVGKTYIYKDSDGLVYYAGFLIRARIKKEYNPEFFKNYLVTEIDDIVYNPANVKYGAIDRNKCGRGLISPIYVTFTTKEVPSFIERIVTSNDFKQRALKFEEGTVTKRQSVNPEDLITLDIIMTSSREEQKQIGDFFDNLDHLITLRQRKCDELKEVKKFMLQNLFPLKG